MRRLTANRRALAVVALLGLLLAGLGAYAIFREVLQARIQVATGSLDFDIVYFVPSDNEPTGGPDIGKCTASLAQDRKSLQVSITNAYPGYECNIFMVFRNDPDESTIPGRFEVREGLERPAPWLSVSYRDPDPEARIDPDRQASADIFIRVEDGAPEGASISFVVSYTFRQYLPYP